MSPNPDYLTASPRRKPLTAAQRQHHEIATKAYEVYQQAQRTAHERHAILAEAEIAVERERAASAMRDAYASGIAISRIGQEIMGTKNYATARAFLDIADPLGELKQGAKMRATSTSEKFPDLTVLPCDDTTNPVTQDGAQRWKITATGQTLAEAMHEQRSLWHPSFDPYKDTLIFKRDPSGKIVLDREAQVVSFASDELPEGAPSYITKWQHEHPLLATLTSRSTGELKAEIREAFSAAFE